MRSRLPDLPEWLQKFTEILEDTKVPALANTSQDSDPERFTKLATRNQSIYTHFLKDPKLRGLQANQDYEGSWQEALAKQYLGLNNLMTWWQQITKFSMRVVNLGTITEMLSWYII